MPSLPGVNHQDAVRALGKAGFGVERQGKHIVMTDGARTITIPRHNPVNAITMGNIVRDAGLTNDEFRKLLWKAAMAELRRAVAAKRSVPWTKRSEAIASSLLGFRNPA